MSTISRDMHPNITAASVEPLNPAWLMELAEMQPPALTDADKGRSNYYPLFVESSRPEAIDKEKRFFTKIYDAAMTMAERSDGTVTLLFDVDETIVDGPFNNPVVRPAFPAVIKELGETLGDRLEVGLLTTRRQDMLEMELEDPQFLGDVMTHVNPDFVMSSRQFEKDYPVFEDLIHNNDDEMKIALTEDIVDPEVIEATRNGIVPAHKWYHTKLAMVQELVNRFPDRSFVLIDDLISAGVIRDDHDRAAGVHVYDEMQNDRIHTPAEQLLQALGKTPVTHS